MDPVDQAGPVPQQDRIDSLDALRGFALLGILPANIIVFGMYYTAGSDPTVTGGATGLNLATWALLQILVQGKMRCLFSMVFGASAILLTSRAEQRTGLSAADIYYRRNFWLLAFGVAHAYLLFWGDIPLPLRSLCPYSVPIPQSFPQEAPPHRRLGHRVPDWLVCLDAFQQQERTNLARAADASVKAGVPPTDKQTAAKKELQAQRSRRKPSREELEADAQQWRGHPSEVIRAHVRAVTIWQSVPYYDATNLDLWSMMFLGMGLYKLGMFSARNSYRTYTRIAVMGYIIGIPLNAYVAWLAYSSNFDRVTVMFTHIAYDVERLSVALAHMAILMLICKAGVLPWLTQRLAAIGQTALSNYILQSVICSFVFTGYGLGLYGRMERYQLYYVVALCWAVSLVASPIWLRHYGFGPLEWCWRSLRRTSWKRQPMRICRAADQSPADLAAP